jgi:hypothetical protein
MSKKGNTPLTPKRKPFLNFSLLLEAAASDILSKGAAAQHAIAGHRAPRTMRVRITRVRSHRTQMLPCRRRSTAFGGGYLGEEPWKRHR